MLISSNIGLDLDMIEKALEKLSFKSDNGNLITVDEIEKYIGFSKEYNNFELQNSLGDKKYDKSIFIINQMFKNKNKSLISITLSLLLNFFRKLILMHSKNFHSTPKNLGIHPYFLKNYQIAKRNYSLQHSIRIIHLLKETDLKSKGIRNNRNSERELMIDLILDIVRSCEAINEGTF